MFKLLACRYTEWVAYDFTLHAADWSDVRCEELHDHDVDADENYNVYLDDDYQETRDELRQLLHDGWWGVAGRHEHVTS